VWERSRLPLLKREGAIPSLHQSVKHNAIALCRSWVDPTRVRLLISYLAPALKIGFLAIAATWKPGLFVDKSGFSGLIENGARCQLSYSSSSSVGWNKSVALLPSSPKMAPMPIFQVVLEVSKMRVCWGERLSFAASQKDAPPERRVKQTTVKKTCWKAGGHLKLFMVTVFSLSTLPSSAWIPECLTR